MSEAIKRVVQFLDARTGMQQLDLEVIHSVAKKNGHFELTISDLRSTLAELAALRVKLETLLKHAKFYRDNWLLDEIDEVELCISEEQHDALILFSKAIDEAISKEKEQP